MWQCPRCQRPLQSVRRPKGPHHVCDGCQGEAVPLPSVVRELGAGASTAIEGALKASSGRVRVRCPACRASMAEVRIAEAYTIDLCRRCRLLWLDHGERAQVRRDPLPALDSDEKAQLAARGRRDLATWIIDRQKKAAFAAPPVSGWRLALGTLGFPVLATDARVTTVPLVTYTLAGLMTLGAWLYQQSPRIADRLGFDEADPLRLAGVTVLTSVMLHGGLLHWLGNVYFWLVVAPSAEEVLGSMRMLALCFAACVTSCLADWLLPGLGSVTIGASGVVSSELVFFALALPHHAVSFFVWSRWSGPRWLTLPVSGAWRCGSSASCWASSSRSRGSGTSPTARTWAAQWRAALPTYGGVTRTAERRPFPITPSCTPGHATSWYTGAGMDPHSIERPDESATTFRLGSVPVALSPSFFVLTVLFGLSRGLAGMASWVLVCFVSVLVHELGHAWMIRRFGGEPAILLYGGGGLTFGNTRETPGQAILVSLAGPAAGFAMAAVAHALFRALPPSPPLDALYDDIFWVNVVWGCANLLPMLPLDGGNAFEALLSLWWPSRARLVAEILTAVCCVGVVGVALSMHWAWPALIAVYWTAPTHRSLFARFERQRDREVVRRIEEVTSQRRAGRTGQAVAMAEQLLAKARTRTYRRAVAEELALLCFDRGDIERATALMAEHFVGVEVPEALWLARALVDHGAAHELDRLERESLASDSPEVFGLFIDACAELDEIDRCVRAIREHGGAHASYRALHTRAAVHFYHGRYELALHVCEIATLVYFNSGVFPYNAACCLARLGRNDEAFAALERALEAADGALTDMDSDPDLESLRSDARWIGLHARATLPSLVPPEPAAQAV